MVVILLAALQFVGKVPLAGATGVLFELAFMISETLYVPPIQDDTPNISKVKYTPNEAHVCLAHQVPALLYTMYNSAALTL